jgi:hypothetical protein
MVAMASDLESAPDDESIWQPMGLETSPAAPAEVTAPVDPPSETLAGPADTGRRASIQLVLSAVGLVALTIIAVALVVIAVNETRQTRTMSRADCMARALDYRPDTFALTPTYRADVAKACGFQDPRGSP